MISYLLPFSAIALFLSITHLIKNNRVLNFITYGFNMLLYCLHIYDVIQIYEVNQGLSNDEEMYFSIVYHLSFILVFLKVLRDYSIKKTWWVLSFLVLYSTDIIMLLLIGTFKAIESAVPFYILYYAQYVNLIVALICYYYLVKKHRQEKSELSISTLLKYTTFIPVLYLSFSLIAELIYSLNYMENFSFNMDVLLSLVPFIVHISIAFLFLIIVRFISNKRIPKDSTNLQ